MAEVVVQSGTPERIAFELMLMIRSTEAASGQKFDRSSILSLYRECLRAAKGLYVERTKMEVSFVEPKRADEA